MLHKIVKTSISVLLCLLIQQNVSAFCADKEQSMQAVKQNKLDQKIELYYSLLEESLQHRVLSLKLYKQLSQELSSKEHLSAANLVLFKQSIKTHLKLREALYSLVRAHECWLEDDYSSMDAQLRLTGIMLSLSAALTLYDNYLLVVAIFQENVYFRRIIDQADMGFELSSNELLEASLAFHSIVNREKVKAAIRFYQAQTDKSYKKHKNDRQWQQTFTYFDTLIKQSPSYRMLRKDSSLSFLHNKIKFYTIVTNDSLVKLEKEGVNLLSLVFGNTIGIVESRKGKLFQRISVQNDLLKTLKAGDILLEKTPFRLTDQFIPGYWGHAAIWIGNEQELKQLGLWQHKLVQPWQQSIRDGHSVIQALRSGVELDPLHRFMNIDDMALLRDKSMSTEQTRQVIINAFRQIGKAYDFNFDVSSSDRIVCSELVYASYLHIDWPTEKTLGRYTISPDHIAVKTRSDKLTVVSLYLDGKQINNQPDVHLLKTLAE